MAFLANHLYALEIQSGFSEAILNGQKTIETREYNLPSPYLLNQPILVLESQQGVEGISSLPDELNMFSHSNVSIVGIITFSECFQYLSCEQWNNDRHLHLVPEGSKYNWTAEYDIISFNSNSRNGSSSSNSNFDEKINSMNAIVDSSSNVSNEVSLSALPNTNTGSNSIKTKWGWRVSSVIKYSVPKSMPMPHVTRIFRSFFDCGEKYNLELSYLSSSS